MSISLDLDHTRAVEAAPRSSSARRLRVAVVNHVAILSGAELALATVLPAVATDVDLVVVLAEDGPLADTLRQDGIDVRVVPLDGRVRSLRRDALAVGAARSVLALVRYVWTLRRLLRDEDIDVVHTNSLKAAFYGGVAGRLARVPVVMHLRDRLASDYLPRPVVGLARLAGTLLPSVVVANSSATLATLPASRRVPRHVVADAVRPSIASATRTVRDDSPPVVGMVGRLAPWKGQDLFLRAFASAFADTDVRGVIVGSAMFGEEHYAASLHRIAADLGIDDRIEFRGFCSDVGSELARFTALVHCSVIPEPFGQVVIEGMSAGLPVVAPAEGGPAEIITHGLDGVLVAPRDESALSTALTALIAEDSLTRARMGRAARMRAAMFTPEAAAGALVSAYHVAAGDGVTTAPAPSVRPRSSAAVA